jgi:hypothetical protein
MSTTAKLDRIEALAERALSLATSMRSDLANCLAEEVSR